jgi:hypothetical protein
MEPVKILKTTNGFSPRIDLSNNITYSQCFGSGSAWFRIKFASWIRIRIPNADPDPAADKMSSKSQNHSDHLELLD